MGPRGSTEWHGWVIEGRTDEGTIKTPKWQELSTDKEDFIGDKEHRGAEGNFAERGDGRQYLRAESVTSFPPSIRGQVRDMKRPQDYSSPDSDTDEFIDVGQEDSFWWASRRNGQLCWDRDQSQHVEGRPCEALYTEIIPVQVGNVHFNSQTELC